jgi:hypothetical protein
MSKKSILIDKPKIISTFFEDGVEVIIKEKGLPRITVTPERTTFKFSSKEEMRKYFFFFKGLEYELKNQTELKVSWRIEYKYKEDLKLDDVIKEGYVTFKNKEKEKNIIINNSITTIVEKLSKREFADFVNDTYRTMNRNGTGVDIFGLEVDSVDVDYEDSSEDDYHDTTVLIVYFKENKNQILKMVFRDNNNGGEGSEVEIKYEDDKIVVIDLITDEIKYYEDDEDTTGIREW